MGSMTSLVTFTGPDALKFFYQINPPGPGEVGAYILASGYIPTGKPGTTLIFKGPNGLTTPQFVLSQRVRKAQTPVVVTITGILPPPTPKP
jgi:hypothetical protein